MEWFSTKEIPVSLFVVSVRRRRRGRFFQQFFGTIKLYDLSFSKQTRNSSFCCLSGQDVLGEWRMVLPWMNQSYEKNENEQLVTLQ
jgi:hypothetical protein